MITECPLCGKPLFLEASADVVAMGHVCDGNCLTRKPSCRPVAASVAQNADRGTQIPPAPKTAAEKPKYGNRKSVCNYGHTHDSRKEANYCNELHLRQSAGEITDLEQQPEFEFSIGNPVGTVPLKIGNRRVRYRADFAYYQNGRRHIIDVKGMKTAVYKLKKALMLACYGIEVEEV